MGSQEAAEIWKSYSFVLSWNSMLCGRRCQSRYWNYSLKQLVWMSSALKKASMWRRQWRSAHAWSSEPEATVRKGHWAQQWGGSALMWSFFHHLAEHLMITPVYQETFLRGCARISAHRLRSLALWTPSSFWPRRRWDVPSKRTSHEKCSLSMVAWAA